MKGKFDFAHALIVIAFLPCDLDCSQPGLQSVDKIHTDLG